MPVPVPGSMAPLFDVLDVRGRRVALSEAKGRYTLLSFNRFAACPLCNLAIRQLSQKAPEFTAKNLRVISFFESSDANLAKALETWGATSFELVGDSSASVYVKYSVPLSAWGTAKSLARMGDLIASRKAGLPKGVGQDGSKTRMPAAFFIGPDLRVIASHVGRDAGDHVSVEQVERWLMHLGAPAARVA